MTVTPTGGSPISATYTVVPSDLEGLNPYGQVDPVYTVANNAANALTQASGGAILALPQPCVIWPQTTPGVGPPQWQMSYNNQAQSSQGVPPVPFTLSVTPSGGLISTIVQQGVQPNPIVTFQEDGVTASGYIAICNYLEQRIALASDLIKFTKADVVLIRQDEREARADIYDYYCERIAEVMGIPLYPLAASSNFGGKNTGMAV
jgi:hypothetical protein